jgi:hypothetical protein
LSESQRATLNARRELRRRIETAFAGPERNLIVTTARHAFAVWVRRSALAERGALFYLYEPNYGLLVFDRQSAFQSALVGAFNTRYYQTAIFGGREYFDIYRADVNLLSNVPVRGNLRVGDLVSDRPFLRVQPAQTREVSSIDTAAGPSQPVGEPSEADRWSDDAFDIDEVSLHGLTIASSSDERRPHADPIAEGAMNPPVEPDERMSDRR